jgi:peroxiredoxin
MKNILFLVTIFAFSIACGTNEDNRGYKVKVGDSCPDFSMELIDGTTITKESLLGKVSVIQFTASWCGVCRKEMPHLETQVWQEFKEEDFILLGVDLKESLEKTTTFIEEMQVTYPIALDTNGYVFEQFTLPKAGVTRNIVLNKEGEIIFLTRLFDKVEFHQMIEVIRKELEK